MSPWTRHLMSLSLLLAVLAGARSEWAGALTATWAALAEARQINEQERQRYERLDGQGDIALRRMAAKQTVVRQLLAGELTLAEAAAWFKYLNEQPGGRPDHFRMCFPCPTAEESACRQVISWAQVELSATSPERAAAAVARLEAELQAQLECSGKVELPDL
jgi:hypothetical protein